MKLLAGHNYHNNYSQGCNFQFPSFLVALNVILSIVLSALNAQHQEKDCETVRHTDSPYPDSCSQCDSMMSITIF